MQFLEKGSVSFKYETIGPRIFAKSDDIQV